MKTEWKLLVDAKVSYNFASVFWSVCYSRSIANGEDKRQT